MSDLANLRFGHSTQRRQRAAQLRLAQTKQKIGLLLPRFDSFAKDRVAVAGVVDRGRFTASIWSRGAIAATGRGHPGSMFNNGIMAGRDVIAAECPGFAPEIAELEFLIAHHTRVRRPTSLIFAGKIINYDALELIGLVHNIMRDPERMRHAARISDRLRPAAFVLRTRDTILRPHLHSHANDVVALFAQQISCDAGVHPTAHAKENALFVSIHFRAKNFDQSGRQSMQVGAVHPNSLRRALWSGRLRSIAPTLVLG